jgi:hypothetical protein
MVFESTASMAEATVFLTEQLEGLPARTLRQGKARQEGLVSETALSGKMAGDWNGYR